eukprot:symbB.v1.2.022091.t1/scaffold1946.1/size95412/3
MTLLCASSGRWAPTVQAACACHVTFVLYGERACEKHWRELLQTERRFQQLTVASRQLFKLLQEPDIRRNAIYLKYADSDQSCISVKVQEKHEKRTAPGVMVCDGKCHCREAIIRQITASVTFLPLLDEPCTFDLLIYTDRAAEVPSAWGESDPKYIVGGSEEVKLRSFTTKIHKVDGAVAYRYSEAGA